MGAGRDLHGLRKDGSVVAVEISLSSFMENGRRYVDAVVADISERKAFEERLQRSEAHMRLLLDTHPDGLLVADAGGRISLVNPALEALFGYGAGELAGRSLADLVPEAGPLLAATLGGAGAGQPSVGLPEREHHLQGRRRDGRPFPVEMSLSAFHEDGESHVLVTFVDRGERLAA